MRNPYVVALIAIVILLIGIEVLLIYIVCCNQATPGSKTTNATTVTTPIAIPSQNTFSTESTTLSTKCTRSTIDSNTTSTPITKDIESSIPTSVATTISTSSIATTSTPFTTVLPSVPPPTISSSSIFPLPTTSSLTFTSSMPTFTTSSTSTNDNYTSTTIKATTEENLPCLIRTNISDFNYILKDAQKVICISANMTIRISLQQMRKSALIVPVNATTTGTCNEKITNMTLNWEENAENQTGNIKKNKITFNYLQNNITFFLDSIFVDVHLNGKHIKEHTMDNNLQLYSNVITHGIFIICKRKATINIGNMINVFISDIIILKSEITKVTKDANVNIGIIIGFIIFGILIIAFFLIWFIKRKRN